MRRSRFSVFCFFTTALLVIAGAAASDDWKPSAYYKRILTYHLRSDDLVPDGSAIFIGDSITQGFCGDAVMSPAINYGIGSDTIAGVTHRLPRYKSLRRAGLIIVEIGVNDISSKINGEIWRDYEKMLAQLPREVPVVIMAIMPVIERAPTEAHPSPITNARIAALNDGIEQIIQLYPKAKMLDLRENLVDENGLPISEFYDPDGVHLNNQGNRIWAEQLRIFLIENLPEIRLE